MAGYFTHKREPVELRGYFMRHKDGGDVGFSWEKADPRFPDDWERIAAVPEVAAPVAQLDADLPPLPKCVAYGIVGLTGLDPNDGHRQLSGVSIGKPGTWCKNSVVELHTAEQYRQGQREAIAADRTRWNAERDADAELSIPIAGLGRMTDDDEGYVTLQFKDEAAAQAFMMRYAPTVSEMPPIREDDTAKYVERIRHLEREADAGLVEYLREQLRQTTDALARVSMQLNTARQATPEASDAWVYECLQPGGEGIWCEFFSREKPSDADYIRNVRGLAYIDGRTAGTALPEGCKVVPVESTMEMDNAGHDALLGRGVNVEINDAEACWSAMIAAAPSTQEGAKP